MAEANDQPTPAPAVSKRTLDEEREYLEGLLTSRFNFYLGFAGVVGAGLTQVQATGERAALVAIAFFLSLLFWRALFRTHVLVKYLLEEIDSDETHPLSRARRRAEAKVEARLFPGNANQYFGQYIPGAITIAFFLAAVYFGYEVLLGG